MPVRCGVRPPTPSISRLMSLDLPARRVKLAASCCRNSAPCVTLMTRSPRAASSRASSAPALARSATPASANSSQILASPPACGASLADASNCGPRAKITERWALSAAGQSATQTVSTKPASCSKLFQLSCEMHGSPRHIVLEEPPALQQPEDQGHEQPRARRLRYHEHPAGPEQTLEPVKRLAQVCGGMQDVGRDDHVERMRIEPLLERVALDVERPALQERILRKFVLRMRSEARQGIGEHVFRAMFRQNRKQKARQAAGSGANFQNSQRLPFRQTPSDLNDGFLHQQIAEAEARRILVKHLRSGRRPFRENEVLRIDLAAEHGRKLLPAEPQQQRFGLTLRELVPQHLPKAMRLLGRSHFICGQLIQHEPEPAAVVRSHA